MSNSSSSNSSCYVAVITPADAKKLYEQLQSGGYAFDQPAFTRFRARKEGLVCTVYLSGKLLVQGRDLPQFLALFFPSVAKESLREPEKKQACPLTSLEAKTYQPCMGFDESGKGDVFGPLCLAGVYVGPKQNEQLVAWGVCDSKQLSDKQILVMADKIRKEFPYEQLILMPERYNALYEKFQNLNRLLAWGHVEVMSALYAKTNCRLAILDQFCAPYQTDSALRAKHLPIELIQRTRAESSEIAVAAASILARAAFVEGMEELTRYAGFIIPKGATHGIVQAGKKILLKHGEEGLMKTIKLHFKTLTLIRA